MGQPRPGSLEFLHFERTIALARTMPADEFDQGHACMSGGKPVLGP